MQQTFDRHIYRILLTVAVLMIMLGTIVYHFVEQYSWVDSYYMSVVTLATVGYGDYVPHTDFGKIFTTFYIIVGVGILTTFISYNFRRRVNLIEQRKEKKK
jgi:voltage-gated potassium channel